jgi:hypothetical protein
VTTATDAALAQLSLNAYSDIPVTLPAGLTPAADLPVTLGAGESFAGGLYRSDNSAALVAEGVVNGQESLVIAFRGSDDQQDSFNDLQNINADYADFTSLFQAVDQAAASGRYDQVVVTGHSLGGSLAQQYMAAHPDQAGVTFDAVTFGSPGAILPAGEDARITNFVIADDPAVALGAHRAEIGEVLRANPTLANLAADKAAEELPGLTEEQALAAINSLTVNYENRGDIVLLPGRSADLSPQAAIAGLAEFDTAQHAPGALCQQHRDGSGLARAGTHRAGGGDDRSAAPGAAQHLRQRRRRPAGLPGADRQLAAGRAGGGERRLHQHPRRPRRDRAGPEPDLVSCPRSRGFVTRFAGKQARGPLRQPQGLPAATPPSAAHRPTVRYPPGMPQGRRHRRGADTTPPPPLPAKGSRSVIVSSRSGLVLSSTTGASTSSSMRRTYFTAAAGRSGVGAGAARGAAPTLHLLVDRLGRGLRARGGGQAAHHLAIDPVARANAQSRHPVQHVELGEREAPIPPIFTACRTMQASNHPQRRRRPVTVPNSRPRSPKPRPTSSCSSVGKGPLPTRVV